MTAMKAAKGSGPEGRARREEYLRLRREGVSPGDAACAVGSLTVSTLALYERWFRAEERGLDIVPARRDAAS